MPRDLPPLLRKNLAHLAVYCWHANAWHPRHPSCLDTLFGPIGFCSDLALIHAKIYPSPSGPPMENGAIRLRGMAPKTSCNAFPWVRTLCSSCICPASSTAVPAVTISQIQSDGQLLLRIIPVLFRRYGANPFSIAGLLFICALSTSITWEPTASCPETGLLIPSVTPINRRNQGKMVSFLRPKEIPNR